MRKTISFIIISLFILITTGCKQKDTIDTKEYYPYDVFKLETFTERTGVKLATKQELEDNALLCQYVVDKEAEGIQAITSYELYLSEFFDNSSEFINENQKYKIYSSEQFTKAYIVTTYAEIDNILTYIVILNGI